MQVPFPCKEQDSVVTPEWHCNPGALVQDNHTGIPEATRIPNSDLSIAHLAETRGSKSILFAHPNDARALDTRVSISDAHGISASARIKQTNFFVPASRDQDIADGIKREALDCVGMTTEDRLWRIEATEVPKFHDLISGSGSKDVFSGWVEKNLTDLTGGTINTRNGIEVRRYPVLLAPIVESRGLDFPNHDFPIVTTGCDDRVVEGRPGSVQDSSGVTSGQWKDFWKPRWECS